MQGQQRTSSQGRAAAGPAPTRTRAEKALPAVVQALERGRRQDAARLFLQGLSHGIAPQDKPLLKWLSRAIGKELTAKLVNAFVHFPCFYCKKGRTRCEDCDARGSLEEGTPCRTCVGIGVARCEFCDGSGWVTLEYVPEGLRPVVIRNRAALALQRMRNLSRQPVGRPSSGDADKTVKRCSQFLLNLDRQMGVFENVLVAVEHLPEADHAKVKLRSLADRCVQTAAKGENRIRETILCMANAFRAAAKTAGKGSRKRSQAERRAEFYAALVDANRTLAGTGLEHPFLHKAVNEAIQRSEPQAQGGGSHKSRRR